MNNSFFKSLQALYKYDLQNENTTILLECNSMSIFRVSLGLLTQMIKAMKSF